MVNRVFKTKGFAATASKALITDLALCAAVREANQGQADDLGGGIWKKRLNENRHRSIILAKGRQSGFISSFLRSKPRAISAKVNLLHLESLPSCTKA
jgi:hypothetical protein